MRLPITSVLVMSDYARLRDDEAGPGELRQPADSTLSGLKRVS